VDRGGRKKEGGGFAAYGFCSFKGSPGRKLGQRNLGGWGGCVETTPVEGKSPETGRNIDKLLSAAVKFNAFGLGVWKRFLGNETREGDRHQGGRVKHFVWCKCANSPRQHQQ